MAETTAEIIAEIKEIYTEIFIVEDPEDELFVDLYGEKTQRVVMAAIIYALKKLNQIWDKVK